MLQFEYKFPIPKVSNSYQNTVPNTDPITKLEMIRS